MLSADSRPSADFMRDGGHAARYRSGYFVKMKSWSFTNGMACVGEGDPGKRRNDRFLSERRPRDWREFSVKIDDREDRMLSGEKPELTHPPRLGVAQKRYRLGSRRVKQRMLLGRNCSARIAVLRTFSVLLGGSYAGPAYPCAGPWRYILRGERKIMKESPSAELEADAPAVKKTTEYKAMPIEDALRELGSGLEGLSKDEVEKRLKTYGRNEVAATKKNPVIEFLSRFWGPMPGAGDRAHCLPWT
jgi:hypothetical protein